MQTFELRLESPDSSQYRRTVLAAEDEAAARAQALAKEAKIVEFDLLPPSEDVWRDPHRSESGDGVVDLGLWDQYDPVFAAQSAQHGTYAEAVKAGEARVRDWTERLLLDGNGKVLDKQLGTRSTARLLAHMQQAPFEVVECREITVEQQAAYATVDGMRELVAKAKELRAANDPRWDPRGWQTIFEQFEQWGVPINAVTAALHGAGLLAHDSGATPIVWGSGTGGDDIYYALLTGYTANPDSHDFWDDVVSTEIANGGGYTTNGVELAGKAFTYDSGSDQTRGDANDISITSSTLSTTDAALVDRTPGSNAARQVIGSIDFGATVTTTAGTFANTWDATGVVIRDYT